MTARLYDNIRKRRKELGMTQSQLAAKMHYADKSMIAKIEKGIVDLPQSKIASFARILETTPAKLMGWTDSEEVPFQNEHYVKIPLCVGFQDGNPVLSPETYELSVNVNNTPAADFMLLLHDKDLRTQTVYVQQQNTFEDGVPFIFYYKNKVLLRQAYRYANETLLLLRSLEPGEADIEVSATNREDLDIIGKVIAIKKSMQ